MSNSVTFCSPKLSPLSSPIPLGIMIGDWKVRGEQVTLIKNADHFSYIYQGQEVNISYGLSKLYGTEKRVVNMIRLFHDVIQLNLEEAISEKAFIPILYSEAFLESEEEGGFADKPAKVYAALFGQEQSDCCLVRWGVFDPLKKIIFTQKASDDSYAIDFFLDLVLTLGSRAQYNEKANSVRTIVNLTDKKELKSVELIEVRNSECDPNKRISAKLWAVTMVSHSGGDAICGLQCGHTMALVEGIEPKEYIGFEQFFKYCHLTNKDADSNCWARTEIKTPDNELKLRLLRSNRGPTWVRPRADIERILIGFQEQSKIYFNKLRGVESHALGGAVGLAFCGVGFAAAFGAIAVPAAIAIFMIFTLLGSLAGYCTKIFIDGVVWNIYPDSIDNCLSYMLRQLKKGGIDIQPSPDIEKIFHRMRKAIEREGLRGLFEVSASCLGSSLWNVIATILPKGTYERLASPDRLIEELNKNSLKINISCSKRSNPSEVAGANLEDKSSDKGKEKE